MASVPSIRSSKWKKRRVWKVFKPNGKGCVRHGNQKRFRTFEEALQIALTWYRNHGYWEKI